MRFKKRIISDFSVLEIYKKVSFFGQNIQLQSALIPEFATRWEVSPIWACPFRRVLSEYTRHTLGSFREEEGVSVVARVNSVIEEKLNKFNVQFDYIRSCCPLFIQYV